MKLVNRWRLQIIDAAGAVMHEELFFRRSEAHRLGRFYVKPLAPSLPQMCNYTVKRNR